MKKMLFIYNPNAGTGVLKPKLSDVLDIFVKAGYEVTVYRRSVIMMPWQRQNLIPKAMMWLCAAEETGLWMRL